MTTRRSIALVTAGMAAILVVVLATVPFLFRDRVEGWVKAEVASGLDARVDWGQTRLSLFRDFPNLTLRLDDLVVMGVDRFEADTLAAIPSFRLVLDLGSVLRSVRAGEAIIVRDVELNRPDVRLVVLEDGARNWDIARERADRQPDAAARPFSLSLRRLEIVDGSVSLDDGAAGLAASVTGLAHSISGDFRQTRFTVSTHTVSDRVSVRFAGVPYLSGARLDVRADLDVDTDVGTITLSESEVRLNELLLALAGSVGVAEDSIALDLDFAAPSTDFRHILSLVPAVYAREFESIRTTGTMAVSGRVRGGYGADAFPALAIVAAVEDGTLRYPDLPLPARDIFLDLAVTNPGGHVDSTIVDLRRIHMVLGSDPVEGSFVMRTPVSDPDVAIRFAGRVDLADLGRTFRLEGVDELAGVVVADGAMHARMSDLDSRRYEDITAEGGLTVAGLILSSLELPHPLRVEEASLQLSPHHAELAGFRGTIGSTDLALTGRIDNLLGFALRDEELRGVATVTSQYVDLDEWRSDDDLEAIIVPRNIDFALDADVARVSFGALEMRNARGGLRLKDQRVTLDAFQLDVLGGAMAVTGSYETTDPALPTFDLDVHMMSLDVPTAFAGLGTVRAFAPVARYAQGHMSAQVRLAGALGQDMTPVYDALSGQGAFQTAGIVLQDFPALDQLADALNIQQLRNPGLQDLQSTFEIRDGRLHVRPFDVRMGPLTMKVSGSNGIDQSLLYSIGLEVPRSILGSEANQAMAALISQTAQAGLQLDPSDVIQLGVQLTGTVTNPSIATDFRGVTQFAATGVAQALRGEADRRVDATAEEARRQARAEAARLMEEAEERAATIRAEARVLAENVRREGYEQADALVARATGPVARAAAQVTANRLRQETDERAGWLVTSADARADAVIAEARRRAEGVPDS